MPAPKDVTHAAICLAFAAVMLLSGCNSQQNSGARAEIRKGDRLTSFSQEITSPIHEFQVKAGSTYTVNTAVKNTGAQPWFGGEQAMSVDVSYRWLDDEGNVLPIDSKRTWLDRPEIRPGETDSLKLEVVAPPNPGSYTLWISMVQEGVDWFFSRGAKPLVLHVTVT